MSPAANNLTECLNKKRGQESSVIRQQLFSQMNDNRSYFQHIATGIFKQELIAVALMDRDFNFIQVNNAYAQADGRDVNDFPGRNHFDFYPDEKVKEIFRKVVRLKKPYQVYARPFIYPKNPERGMTYWDLTLVPIVGYNDQVEFLFLTLNDVTEHHLKNMDYQRFFELSMDLFCVLDLKTGCLREVNPVFEKTSGYTRQELFTTHYLKFVHPEDRRITQEKVNQLAKGKPINFFKHRVICRDGSCRILRWNASSIPEEDLVYAVARDITKLKETEIEMARLEKLNLIGEMAAGLGHEIKNPLTTVRGFLQVLGGKKDLCLYRDYLNLMIDELDRADSLVTQFLCLAKNAPTQKKNQNLNTIIELLSPLIKAHAIKHDIYAEFQLGDIPDLMLDGKEMRQLILNLVNNGIEAMSPGGSLKIFTYKKEKEVLLAIQDTGKGIDVDVMGKIGTPFFTTKENGTGLGLSICYSIANRHNARITLETGPRGTTFFVRFQIS